VELYTRGNQIKLFIPFIIGAVAGSRQPITVTAQGDFQWAIDVPK